MKKFFLVLVLLLLIGLGAFASKYIVQGFLSYQAINAEKQENLEQKNIIDEIIEARRKEQMQEYNYGPDDEVSPFVDGKVHILLLGLDKRLGQIAGHCDAIQFVTIDQTNKTVSLLAVPRGTYSPLPPGKGATSTDYYVSNACGLGGLEYGIKQIEKIAGVKADYIVVVGFSEVLGILRSFELPTTETLQWLRRRHEYAIGEPQRAHNHSTFLKELLVHQLPKTNSGLDRTFSYILYKTLQTDLSFAQTQMILDTLINMDLSSHPEQVQLSMRPAHPIQDIPYDPEHLNIKPGTDTLESIQKKLFDTIEQKKNDTKFVRWAFDNDLWLQVDDAQKREQIHYDFLVKYLDKVPEKDKRKELIGDYVLEMEHLGQSEWKEKGEKLLGKELAFGI